jgi:hypothetical protein
MALSAVLVGREGLAHARVDGLLTVGPDFGEVPAVGLDQLVRLRLPYEPRVYVPVGFEEQFYILSKSIDGLVTDIRLDATQFEYDSVSPILRLRFDLTAAPAQIEMWLEAHHSVGR